MNKFYYWYNVLTFIRIHLSQYHGGYISYDYVMNKELDYTPQYQFMRFMSRANNSFKMSLLFFKVKKNHFLNYINVKIKI